MNNRMGFISKFHLSSFWIGVVRGGLCHHGLCGSQWKVHLLGEFLGQRDLHADHRPACRPRAG